MNAPQMVGQTMADIDVCCAVSEDLMATYPGYPWAVGVSHDGGTIAIDLAVEKPPALRQFGYLLHLSSLMEAGGQAKVRLAGGELLERYGLRRGRAQDDVQARAKENGLDVSGSSEGDYWLRKMGR